MFFPNPFQRPLLTVQSSMYAQKFWERFSTLPQASRNGHLGHQFQPKSIQNHNPTTDGDPRGADLGAIWRRKRPQNQFFKIFQRFYAPRTHFYQLFLIFAWFWMDFEQIVKRFWLHFWMDFRRTLTDSWRHFSTWLWFCFRFSILDPRLNGPNQRSKRPFINQARRNARLRFE